MDYHKPSDTCYTTLYLAPGKYEFKFSYERKWILEEGRANNGSNHELTVPHQPHPRIFHSNLEAVRQYISRRADEFFPFR